MAEIAWNTNELETLARNINNCRNALQTQQRRLIQLSRETQDGWKSDAGNLYATRLNEDIQELNRTIQALSTAITRLRRQREFTKTEKNGCTEFCAERLQECDEPR